MATSPYLPFRPIGVFTAAVIAAGCGLVTGPSEADLLEAARAKWEGQSLRHAYSFDITRSCFCAYPDALPRARVIVIDQAIVHASDAVSSETLPPAVVATIPTVEGLFDLIAGALEDGADRVQIHYDPTSGAPLEISIDWIRHAVDDELFIAIQFLGEVIIDAPPARTP